MATVYPDVLDAYTCKCGACRRTCCRDDWDVAVSVEEASAARGHDPAMAAYGIQENPHAAHGDADAFRIVTGGDGRCALLSRDGFCSWQMECGSCLSRTCAEFPRTAIEVGGVRYACGSLACEAIVEALIGREVPIALIHAEKPVRHDDLAPAAVLGDAAMHGTIRRASAIDGATLGGVTPGGVMPEGDAAGDVRSEDDAAGDAMPGDARHEGDAAGCAIPGDARPEGDAAGGVMPDDRVRLAVETPVPNGADGARAAETRVYDPVHPWLACYDLLVERGVALLQDRSMPVGHRVALLGWVLSHVAELASKHGRAGVERLFEQVARPDARRAILDSCGGALPMPGQTAALGLTAKLYTDAAARRPAHADHALHVLWALGFSYDSAGVTARPGLNDGDSGYRGSGLSAVTSTDGVADAGPELRRSSHIEAIFADSRHADFDPTRLRFADPEGLESTLRAGGKMLPVPFMEHLAVMEYLHLLVPAALRDPRETALLFTAWYIAMQMSLTACAFSAATRGDDCRSAGRTPEGAPSNGWSDALVDAVVRTHRIVAHGRDDAGLLAWLGACGLADPAVLGAVLVTV